MGTNSSTSSKIIKNDVTFLAQWGDDPVTQVSLVFKDGDDLEKLRPTEVAILVNGQKYTVARDVAPREIPFDDEAFIIWDIVTEEECGGGLWFTKVGENYLACLDDWIPCHLVANVQVMLPLPDRFVLYENPDGEEVVAHTADDFLTWLREGGWDVYNQYNSTAKFENGELVSISVSGYPHGPETGDTAAKVRNNSSTRKYAGTVRLTPFQQQLLKL